MVDLIAKVNNPISIHTWRTNLLPEFVPELFIGSSDSKTMTFISKTIPRAVIVDCASKFIDTTARQSQLCRNWAIFEGCRANVSGVRPHFGRTCVVLEVQSDHSTDDISRSFSRNKIVLSVLMYDTPTVNQTMG